MPDRVTMPVICLLGALGSGFTLAKIVQGKSRSPWMFWTLGISFSLCIFVLSVAIIVFFFIQVLIFGW